MPSGAISFVCYRNLTDKNNALICSEIDNLLCFEWELQRVVVRTEIKEKFGSAQTVSLYSKVEPHIGKFSKNRRIPNIHLHSKVFSHKLTSNNEN